ncbi:7539_t:CDS:2 [Entrophospora sp. SA101]|nr:7539_t:CDS:2 [Entrophospora sp. SA101]
MFYRNPNEIFIEELLAAYDLLNEQKSPNLDFELTKEELTAIQAKKARGNFFIHGSRRHWERSS